MSIDCRGLCASPLALALPHEPFPSHEPVPSRAGIRMFVSALPSLECLSLHCTSLEAARHHARRCNGHICLNVNSRQGGRCFSRAAAIEPTLPAPFHTRYRCGSATRLRRAKQRRPSASRTPPLCVEGGGVGGVPSPSLVTATRACGFERSRTLGHTATDLCV